MNFIGRFSELQLLLKEYQESRGSLVPIFGRRRIGKSQLIVEFARGKPTLFFTAFQSTRKHNLNAFGRIAAEVTGLRSLENADNWEDVLRDSVQGWQASARKILVFDEIQWAVQTSKELPSVLQKLWDHEWQHRKDLMIILCGSHVGFFRDQILRAKSPLYGRRTQCIHLHPFNIKESAAFHPKMNFEDQAKIYFLTGGIAHYLQQFQEDSIEHNIVLNYIGSQGRLANEADYLLHEEIKQVPTAMAILSAIAEGHRQYGQIAQEVGIETSNLQYFMEPLEAIGFVEKKHPLFEKAGKTHKQIRYEIADPFLRFWFRFFPPSCGMTVFERPESVFSHRIRPCLDSYWGNCWERTCRKYLPLLYAKEHLFSSAVVGEYWNKDCQIDVVSIRDDDWIDLGECCWGHHRSLTELARELEHRIPFFPNPSQKSLGRRLFVRSWNGGPPEGYKVHTLKDFYSDGSA